MQQVVEVVLQSYRDFYLFLVSLFVGDCDYIFFFSLQCRRFAPASVQAYQVTLQLLIIVFFHLCYSFFSISFFKILHNCVPHFKK